MIKWDEQRLKEFVRKMGLRRTSGQGKTPIHLSLYGPSWNSEPLLTQVMRLDAAAWAALGYAETDRVSVVQYLGGLKCRTDDALRYAAKRQQPLTPELAKLLIDAGSCDKGSLSYAALYQQPLTLELAKLLIDARAFDKDALSYAARDQQPLTLDLAKLLIDARAFDKDALRTAAEYQQPLTLDLAKLLIDVGAFDELALSSAACSQHPLSLELAKLLIDAGAFGKGALSIAAANQHPLTLELAKLLIDAGCDPTAQNGNGWDALVRLAWDSHPVDPQVTDLFLSYGCRTDLDGCTGIFDEHRLRFDRILKEHAEWMTKRLDRECALESPPCDLNWGW